VSVEDSSCNTPVNSCFTFAGGVLVINSARHCCNKAWKAGEYHLVLGPFTEKDLEKDLVVLALFYLLEA
jgi:hypothetical protein